MFYMFIVFRYILALILLSSGEVLVYAEPLPLTCYAIPHHEDKICTVITPGALGPFDDAVIYRQDARGEWTLLNASKNDVSTFDGLGFSNDGQLMWMSWAEEGHPTLSFFRTNDYLTGESEELAILDDYRFAGLIRFTNQGKVIYKIMPDDGEHCPDGRRARDDVCKKILQIKLH